MRKVLGLICLSLFMGLSLHAEEVNIQEICKEQREKVNEMVKTIASIRDQSIRNYLNQVWIDFIIEEINKQETSKEENFWLVFRTYYAPGLVLAYKKIDDRIQAYKKDYDNLPDWKKNETANPYEQFYIKNGDMWDSNPKNSLYFYFSLQDKQNPKYTLNDLRKYLQEYVDCTQVTKEGEEIVQTDRYIKFMNENKLWVYEAQELSDLIIQTMLELGKVKYNTYDRLYIWVDRHFVDLCACNFNLTFGIPKNITLQEATEQIKAAVYALSPIKYNDVMEILNLEAKQKGMSDTKANKESEKKLNSIIQVYANKLVEKARG